MLVVGSEIQLVGVEGVIEVVVVGTGVWRVSS